MATIPNKAAVIRKRIHSAYHEVLVFLRLSPLSLAEKCRIAFGSAVIFVLVLALLIPYMWMGKLTTKACLDAGRAKTETLLRSHFQLKQTQEGALAPLDNAGNVMDVNDSEIVWVRFGSENKNVMDGLSEEQKQIIADLQNKESRDDNIYLQKQKGGLKSTYVRIFRATDTCLSCHYSEGSANPFGHNQLIGAAIIERPAAGISRTILLNRVWIIAAVLIAGTGAIVTFYMITQRVILRPIRQLRALVNNVAEGNLDVRSSINTRDEYQNFAEAFNNMLDGLQSAQEKLRQTNKQLDTKIAELSERNIELYKANKLKSEFLANMSHEFRTPMNSILGFAEILREKPGLLKKDKGQRYAENIITSGKRLLNMINDLLEMAKSQAGRLQLHIEKTSASELCKTVVSSFAPLTKKKKIKVKLKTSDDIGELETDTGKVQQILYNFLSNAVNFTPHRGRIEIKASKLDDKHVRISVQDNGCGIAENDRKKIFEKFQQADGSITRESTGNGLGLAISSELAAMLAGSIGLESEVGKGSTFWLDIPMALTK